MPSQAFLAGLQHGFQKQAADWGMALPAAIGAGVGGAGGAGYEALLGGGDDYLRSILLGAGVGGAGGAGVGALRDRLVDPETLNTALTAGEQSTKATPTPPIISPETVAQQVAAQKMQEEEEAAAAAYLKRMLGEV